MGVKKELTGLVKDFRKYLDEFPDPSFPGKVKRGLRDIYSRFSGCRRCALSKTRNKMVFGEGNPAASLVFIGEAPGRDEDNLGRPFVGRAGKLLDNILQSVGFSRRTVYITNIIKCRPPLNRNPLPEEIGACRKILSAQLEEIRPSLICALGKFAAQTLLERNDPIGRMRGNWFALGAAKVLVTYHPAYLLRNPGDKKLVWEDMKKLRKEYEKNRNYDGKK